ncbi:pectate lyase family protein [Streptomyces sp. NPDC054796]
MCALLAPGSLAHADTHTGTSAARGGGGPGGPGGPGDVVLPEGDGWASLEGGTTGGAGADKAHTHTVRTRAQLAAALEKAGDEPTVIKVKGTIDGNTDDRGRPLSCEDYATDGYTLEKYLAAYDPETWGDKDPEGPMEDARLASSARQKERVALRVPSNTTLVGVGGKARLLGVSLQIADSENVIVRGLRFEDAFDCFPQWDPDDNTTGAWNSEYDNLVVTGSRHVWVDHNSFTDGRRPDSAQPHHFGALFQQHDGLLDIVRGADLVTVSWNELYDHDKSVLIGNSDGAGATDRGRLRATFHHNLFRDLNERVPRVRFGKVDVYNNHYKESGLAPYGYSWGLGFESALVGEHNAFTLPDTIAPYRVIHPWVKGAAMTESGNYVNGEPFDVLRYYNTQNPVALVGDDAGWTPSLRPHVDDPADVPRLVARGAGAGKG